MRWACLGLLLGLLSGCAIQPAGPVNSEQALQAARANTEIAAYHLQRGAYAQAIEKIERALAQAPDFVSAHIIAAELHARLEQPDIARRHYQRALQIEPGNGSALNNYAAFLCRASEIDQALDLWSLAASDPLYSGRAMALANAARCLANAGRWAAAQRYWQDSLDLQPDYSPALAGLAEAERRLQKRHAAREDFSRYTAVSGESGSQLADRVHRDE